MHPKKERECSAFARLTHEEKVKLGSLAEKYGETEAAWIRRAIQEAWISNMVEVNATRNAAEGAEDIAEAKNRRNMDPDANLEEQLQLAKSLDGSSPLSERALLRARRLAELVVAMDEWLARGGRLPSRWAEVS